MNLANRTAIVTGGAVRLGRAIALALAEQGCHIVVHYGSSEAAAEQTANEIRDFGVRALTVQADLNEPATAAKTVFDAAVAEFGAIDFLINSAAIFEAGTLADLTDDHWDRHFAINVKSPVFLSQQFAARRAPGARGQIVNIADWRATRPVPGHLAYTLTKSALVGLTKVLAHELGPDMQVNAVAPGAILPAPDADENSLNAIAQRIPLKRSGAPADVADAVLFLLRSDFLTGETIHVAGGEQL